MMSSTPSHRTRSRVPALTLACFTVALATSVVALEKEPTMITIDTPQDLGYRKRPYGGGWYVEGVEFLDGLEHLTITGQTSGTVVLRPSTTDEVQVRVTRVANSRKSDEAHELLAEVPVYLERHAGDAILTTKDLTLGPGVSVHYHVELPATVAVSIDLPQATIKAKGIQGPIDVSTQSVVFELRSPRGDVQVNSQTGVIEATFNGDEEGTYDFRTDTGSFIVKLGPRSKTELRARNDEGKIEAFDALDVVERDARSLHALYNGGGVGISMQTRKGDIRITRS